MKHELSIIQRDSTRSGPPGADSVIYGLERAERRVVAFSFLVLKIVTVVTVVLALFLMEAGFIKRVYKTEFGPSSMPSLQPIKSIGMTSEVY